MLGSVSVSQTRSTAERTEQALLELARRGDERAFAELVEPHRRAIHVHAYRMLGSLEDAEDLTQETYLRAWRYLDTYDGRGSFRGWLYRIATNTALRSIAQRRSRVMPQARGPARRPEESAVPPQAEPVWLEPYPDALLDVADESLGPEARLVQQESIRLAFVAALQLLPARQRAVLLMRDVLGLSAAEVAATLEIGVAAANSVLQRARANLERRLPSAGVAAVEGRDHVLLERLVRAFESADVTGLVELLRRDAILAMPPYDAWYQGREAIGRFFETQMFPMRGPLRMRGVGANRQPTFAFYERVGDVDVGLGLMLVSVRGPAIAELDAFPDPALLARFELPATIAADIRDLRYLE